MCTDVVHLLSSVWCQLFMCFSPTLSFQLRMQGPCLFHLWTSISDLCTYCIAYRLSTFTFPYTYVLLMIIAHFYSFKPCFKGSMYITHLKPTTRLWVGYRYYPQFTVKRLRCYNKSPKVTQLMSSKAGKRIQGICFKSHALHHEEMCIDSPFVLVIVFFWRNQRLW